MKVYFGHYEFKPDEVDELPEEYRRLICPERHQLPDYDFWTNNVLFVEPFEAEEVMVCNSKSDHKRLCDYSDWPRIKDVLRVGEFLSCVYDKRKSDETN